MNLKSTGRPASLRPYTPLFQDIVAWFLAIPLAWVLRYELQVGGVDFTPVLYLGIAAGALQFVLGSIFCAYPIQFHEGSLEEARALSLTTVCTGLVLAIPSILFGIVQGIPRSTFLIATPLAILMVLGFRYFRRATAERRTRAAITAEPAIILGAGFVGSYLIRRMFTDPDTPYLPVALLDDDPATHHLRVASIAVKGTLGDLGRVAESSGAKVLIVAIADPAPALLRKVTEAAALCGLEVKVLPALAQILTSRSPGADLRSISMEDLLGRAPVDTEIQEIASYLTGKRVLVTGAGGSIGAELCHQIQKFNPQELILLDRDETGLQSTQLLIQGHGLLDTPNVVLGDIRDAETMNALFLDRKPEVVFHAAALKHLPMLELYPEEAWKTNVLGTLNVLNAAELAGVETFINISTDKAADPTSVLGYSKRNAEMLTSSFANTTGNRYLSVRFGNVFGSRGSMLPTFVSLIEKGGPITVTHPDITRYFMSIPEACQLVVQAGAIGRKAEVRVLDMGEPVSILEIAKRMIDLSGKDIAIVFTGLREGEKLHEVLTALDEGHARPFHPKISHISVAPLSPTQLDKALWLSTLPRDLLRN